MTTTPPRETHESLRFPGLSPGARAFFQALDREPCPTAWPGADRVAYVAHVLGPLKALVSDLARELADEAPRLSLEARVGGSLAWPRELAPDSADCPVRCIRAWDADATPTTSPLLLVAFAGRKIEIGLDAGGDPSASDRIRAALLGPEEGPRAEAATLACAGWHVETLGGADGQEADPTLPEGLHGWFTPGSIRVTRPVAWEPWLQEPGFALEVRDRFRELLPIFDLMRAPVTAPADSPGRSGS